MIEIIIAILSGSALSALITQIGTFVIKKVDRKDIKNQDVDSDISSLKEGM